MIEKFKFQVCMYKKPIMILQTLCKAIWCIEVMQFISFWGS